jgi:hypothetical protein
VPRTPHGESYHSRADAERTVTSENGATGAGRRRAGSVRRRVRIAAAGSALALVSWQAVASVVDVGAEVLARPLRHRLLALSASPEERIRVQLGNDFEVWRAVDEHVPAGSRVLVSYSKETPPKVLNARLLRLRAMTCPTGLQGWPFDPRQAASGGPGRAARREYVLDLESGRDYSAWPSCVELARGKGFRLLILESAAR